MSRVSVLAAALAVGLAGLCGSAFAADANEFDCLIEPRYSADMGSQIEGVLDEMRVQRGDSVKKGQVVATLEAGVERANVELARARLALTAAMESADVRSRFGTRKYERMEEMRKQGQFASAFEVDQADTERRLAELDALEARENQRLAALELDRAVKVLEVRSLRSPFNGVVVDTFLSPGERVQQEPILRLAQIDPLYVEVILPASRIGSVAVGYTGLVKPEVGAQGPFQAKVVIVDRLVNAGSGTFGVRLALPNPEQKIPAGLKCRVSFRAASAAPAGR